MSQAASKAVLITTKHRGVFYAEVDTTKDLTTTTITGLKNCRMAISWRTTRGLMELAEVGPNKDSKISAPADISVLHDITAVFDVTEKAQAAWTQQ